jgi:hypothetical protein
MTRTTFTRDSATWLYTGREVWSEQGALIARVVASKHSRLEVGGRADSIVIVPGQVDVEVFEREGEAPTRVTLVLVAPKDPGTKLKSELFELDALMRVYSVERVEPWVGGGKR